MADLRGFDANEVEPSVGFDPIPAGNYEVVLVGSEMKDTKTGDGQYLQLEFEVIAGEYKGRKLWDRLTLQHSNSLTVKIARGKLSSLCRACGVMQPKDSCELHNLPITAKVRVKRRKDIDELSNEIAAYEKREAATGKPVQAASDTPPWRRQSREEVPF
jgi:hypothetical protein